MKTKEALSVLAALALLPACARAQSIDWSRDPVAQVSPALKTPQEGAPAIPAVHAALVPARILATSQESTMVPVPVCAEEPKGGSAQLTLDADGRLGALFTDADQISVKYTFYPDLVVADGKIVARDSRAVIGQVSGNPARPTLAAGFSLQVQYGGSIDSCTGADRVFVDVLIAGPAQASSAK